MTNKDVHKIILLICHRSRECRDDRMTCFRMPGEHQLVPQRVGLQRFIAVHLYDVPERVDRRGVPLHLRDHLLADNDVQVVHQRRGHQPQRQKLGVLLRGGQLHIDGEV